MLFPDIAKRASDTIKNISVSYNLKQNNWFVLLFVSNLHLGWQFIQQVSAWSYLKQLSYKLWKLGFGGKCWQTLNYCGATGEMF